MSAIRSVRPVLLWLLAVGLSGDAAISRTIEVKRPRSLRQAIEAAARGDVIRVQPGTYIGNLVLDKPVTLEGTGRPVIRGDGRGSTIVITAERCAVRGFAIERSGDRLEEEDSGILLKSRQNTIEGNDLRDVLFGIYLFHSDDNRIIGNVIEGRATLEIGERGSGIHVWNSAGNAIVGNTITRARDGMYFQNAYRSVVRGNRITELRYGLHYMYSDDNLFEDNLFSDNIAGAAIMYSKRIAFRHNLFIHDRGVNSFGILFQGDDDCQAEENLVVDNSVGIFMEALKTSIFRRNLVAANDTAIEIFSSASGNTFEANNFVENLSPVWVVGRHTETQWNGLRQGNYWSEYSGYDLDGDGVGDVPFRIQNVFEHMEGNYPRLRLYLSSPAAQALALAEKAFPVLGNWEEYDRLPLMKPVAVPVRMPEATQPRRPSLALLLPLLMISSSAILMIRGNHR